MADSTTTPPRKTTPEPVAKVLKPKTLKPKTLKPKTFSLHWGSGIVEEEAIITTPHHRPCIQLLKFTDGEAAGQYEVRFCYYDHRGQFQRSPMILDEQYLDEMRAALTATPKLKRLLAKLVRAG